MSSSPSASQSSWSLIDDPSSDAHSIASTIDHLPLPDESEILRSRLSDLERKNAILEDQLQDLLYTTTNQSGEIKTVRRKLAELEDERTYLVAGLDPARKELEGELRRLRVDLGRERDKSRKGVLEDLLSQSGLEETEEAAEIFRALWVNQQKRIEELSKDLEQSTKELTEKILENQELHYINQNLETQNAKLTAEIKEMGGNEEKLKNYKNSMSNIKKKYKKQLEMKEKELKGEYKKKQDEVRDEKQRAQDGTKKGKDKQNEIEELKKKNDKLSKIIEKAKRENEEVNELLEKSQMEVDRLSEEVEGKLKIIEGLDKKE